MSDERSAVVESQVPLNLTVRRAPHATTRRASLKQPLSLLGLIGPAALLLVFGGRNRFGVPTAAALATCAITAAVVVTCVVSHRRKSAREAVIDERIEQSFPASDPAPV